MRRLTQLVKEKVCINQLARPRFKIKMEGKGDCTICQYDPEENMKCKGYFPITLYDVKINGEY